MWETEKNAELDKKLKKFAKRHRTEARNSLDNLAAYLGSLRGGLKPQQVVRGCIHSEGSGLIAFDESGPGHPNKATRLYVYPEEETETLYAITIGDKDSQRDDVKFCHEFLDSLRAVRKRAKEGSYADEPPEETA